MVRRAPSKSHIVDKVLVVGAGIAGMQAALDLAELGVQVFLLEKNRHIGGFLSSLDKQFPENHCGMCRILPIPNGSASFQFCLRRGLKHPNIKILTNTMVERVRGKAGRFEVSVKKKGSYIDEYKCTACCRCIEVCPLLKEEEKKNESDSQKVIHAVSQRNIPYVLVIDEDICSKCGECVRVCPTNAIVLQPKDERFTLTVGAVIHSSGFKEFDCSRLSKYGYKIYENVITGLDLELLMAEKFGRPSDGKIPRKMGFIQCVGSRNARLDLNYCSSVCCMYAMKEALMLKNRYPEMEICIFFIDLRIFGKNHYRYFEKVKAEKIEFVRCVPSVEEISESKNILLTYEKPDGTIVRDQFDLVVLSAGFSPPEDASCLNEIFGIDLNKYGFCKTSGVDTSVKGNYVCGSFVEPKDIENSIIEASAAALKALRVLGSVCNRQPSDKNAPLINESATEKPRIGIFVCHCWEEISQKIDIASVATFARGLPNVCDVKVADCLCFSSILHGLKANTKSAMPNRMIFAACAFHSRREAFEEFVSDIGLARSNLEIVDLREQIAWIHDDKQKATLKAKALLAMAVSKISQEMPQVPLPSPPKIASRVTVIGAGVTGMTASLSIAEMGVHVDLIEKTDRLGGKCTYLLDTLEGMDIPGMLNETLRKVRNNKLIHVHEKSEVVEVEGEPGNFVVRVKNPQEMYEDIKSGAIVVATGAEEYTPREHLYGEDKRILTQLELEKKISDHPTIQPFEYSTAVMIQCVGSFSEKHPYCSRFCCGQAIKNGLKIKKINPQIQVFILFQEMMTYGFKEEYYAEARNAGIVFVRFPPASPPNVTISDNAISLKVHDTNLHEDLLLHPDLIVLSNGFTPNLKENEKLAGILGISLNDDGFFKELDPRFRPLDSAKCGVFICGTAHSPRNVAECIVQAQAVSIKVLSFIHNQQKRASSIKDKPFVDVDLCCGCGLCALVCPNGARRIDERRRVSEISLTLCQGCGLCGVACANGATKVLSSTQDQIMAMVDVDLNYE